MNLCIRALIVAVCILLCSSRDAAAQYSMIGTPFQSASGSFSENFNLGWGINGPGFNFNWNGGNANPPFGPFDPNGGAQFGGAFHAGPFSGGFRLNAGQAADTTLVSQTPSVTVMNGQTGYFSDTTIRPFVTGFIPVVGQGVYNIPQPVGGSYYASPLQERIERLQAQGGPHGSSADEDRPVAPAGGGGQVGPSSAERGAASVADIKAGQAARADAKQKEIGELLAKADALAAEGKNTVAKLFYQQAARRAEGEQRAEIAAKIKRLE